MFEFIRQSETGKPKTVSEKPQEQTTPAETLIQEMLEEVAQLELKKASLLKELEENPSSTELLPLGTSLETPNLSSPEEPILESVKKKPQPKSPPQRTLVDPPLKTGMDSQGLAPQVGGPGPGTLEMSPPSVPSSRSPTTPPPKTPPREALALGPLEQTLENPSSPELEVQEILAPDTADPPGPSAMPGVETFSPAERVAVSPPSWEHLQESTHPAQVVEDPVDSAASKDFVEPPENSLIPLESLNHPADSPAESVSPVGDSEPASAKCLPEPLPVLDEGLTGMEASSPAERMAVSPQSWEHLQESTHPAQVVGDPVDLAASKELLEPPENSSIPLGDLEPASGKCFPEPPPVPDEGLTEPPAVPDLAEGISPEVSPPPVRDNSSVSDEENSAVSNELDGSSPLLETLTPLEVLENPPEVQKSAEEDQPSVEASDFNSQASVPEDPSSSFGEFSDASMLNSWQSAVEDSSDVEVSSSVGSLPRSLVPQDGDSSFGGFSESSLVRSIQFVSNDSEYQEPEDCQLAPAEAPRELSDHSADNHSLMEDSDSEMTIFRKDIGFGSSISEGDLTWFRDAPQDVGVQVPGDQFLPEGLEIGVSEPQKSVIDEPEELVHDPGSFQNNAEEVVSPEERILDEPIEGALDEPERGPEQLRKGVGLPDILESQLNEPLNETQAEASDLSGGQLCVDKASIGKFGKYKVNVLKMFKRSKSKETICQPQADVEDLSPPEILHDNPSKLAEAMRQAPFLDFECPPSDEPDHPLVNVLPPTFMTHPAREEPATKDLVESSMNTSPNPSGVPLRDWHSSLSPEERLLLDRVFSLRMQPVHSRGFQREATEQGFCLTTEGSPSAFMGLLRRTFGDQYLVVFSDGRLLYYPPGEYRIPFGYLDFGRSLYDVMVHDKMLRFVNQDGDQELEFTGCSEDELTHWVTASHEHLRFGQRVGEPSQTQPRRKGETLHISGWGDLWAREFIDCKDVSCITLEPSESLFLEDVVVSNVALSGHGTGSLQLIMPDGNAFTLCTLNAYHQQYKCSIPVVRAEVLNSSQVGLFLMVNGYKSGDSRPQASIFPRQVPCLPTKRKSKDLFERSREPTRAASDDLGSSSHNSEPTVGEIQEVQLQLDTMRNRLKQLKERQVNIERDISDTQANMTRVSLEFQNLVGKIALEKNQ